MTPKHIKQIIKDKPCPFPGQKWCERCKERKDKYTPIKNRYKYCQTCHAEIYYLDQPL